MMHKNKLTRYLSNPYSKIWYLIAAIVFITLFVFLVLTAYQNAHLLKFPFQGLFLPEGDTSTYYSPLEDIVLGKGYTSVCRMPALLPIYIPLRLLFDVSWTKNIIILLQIATSILASVLLSRIAYKITKSLVVFYLTLGLYVTSFLLIEISYIGYMDSFAVSFLIIGYYFIVCKKWNLTNLLLSGLFIGWSIFFRQVLGLNIFIAALYIFFTLFSPQTIRQSIFKTAVFVSPFLTALIIWNSYTLVTYNKTPILVQAGEKCWKGYPPQLNKVVNLAIAWGGNFTKWNGEAQWFITSYMAEDDFPFSTNVMTSEYNLDSLILLRRNLLASMDPEIPEKEKEELAILVSNAATKYKNRYVKENPFSYYFLNKLTLLRKFIIPKQIDGLILPPLKEMNILQIALKTFWWSSFAIINVLGLIGFILLLIQKRGKEFLLHLSFIIGFLYIVFYAGFIEQRYIAPYLPFIYIYCAYLITKIWTIISKTRSATSTS